MEKEKIIEEIQRIRQEIIATPYHKGTEHHIGRLRARIARLEDQLLQERLRKSRGGGGSGYAVSKSGDATVVLVGFPSVGKSTLLNVLSNARSKVGHYPFTTLDVIPGMMTYQGAKIQILDIPGLIIGAASGRGRGREILSVVRVADLALLAIEARSVSQKEAIVKELEAVGIRLDEKKPLIFIKKKNRGGIVIKNTFYLQGISPSEALGMATELLKIKNGEIILREKVDRRQFADALLGNRAYLPSLTIFTKSDLLSHQEKKMLEKKYPRALFLSAWEKEGLDKLKEEIFQKLELIRVFLKPPDGEVDFSAPLILRRGATIATVAQKINRALKSKENAFVWGKSVKYPGQIVGQNHLLEEGDIVLFK